MPPISLLTSQPESNGEPVFDAPWQARAFSIAVSLNEAGCFEWSEWADEFSASIEEYEKENKIESSDDYYRLWLHTLERISLKMTDELTK